MPSRDVYQAIEQRNPPAPDELKECPFCGGSLVFICGDSDKFFSVVCHECNTEGPTSRNREAAITKWNTRS